MLGTVLDYANETGEGLISGDDGERYTFQIAEWKDPKAQPTRGIRVDFVGESGTAFGIYRTAPAQGWSGTTNDLTEAVRRLVEPAPGAAGDTVEPIRRFLGFLVEIGIGFVVNLVVTWIVFIPAGVSAFRFGIGVGFAWLALGRIITVAAMFAHYWLMYTLKGAGVGHLLI